MSGIETEVESEQGQGQESSSGDVRSAIQDAVREVSERARDESGRFAKNEGETKPLTDTEEELSPPVAKPIEAAPAEAAAAESQPAAIKPPDAWSPAAKAKFAALDPEIQAEVMRREVEVHKGFTKFDEHRNIGKTFSEVVAPYLPMIRAEGGEPLAAVQELLQTAHNLRTASPENKEQMFVNLARQFNVNMQGVFNRLAGGQQSQDPQVQQLQQQLQSQQQQFAELQRQIQQGTQSTIQAEQAQYQSQIESFASDPKNIYFENVKPAMATLIRDGMAKDLQEAYDMACWARPDIRPLLLQQTEQQKQAAAQAKAQKARAAGVSISGSPTGSAGVVAPADRSLADELRANLREVMGRN